MHHQTLSFILNQAFRQNLAHLIIFKHFIHSIGEHSGIVKAIIHVIAAMIKQGSCGTEEKSQDEMKDSQHPQNKTRKIDKMAARIFVAIHEAACSSRHHQQKEDGHCQDNYGSQGHSRKCPLLNLIQFLFYFLIRLFHRSDTFIELSYIISSHFFFIRLTVL